MGSIPSAHHCKTDVLIAERLGPGGDGGDGSIEVVVRDVAVRDKADAVRSEGIAPDACLSNMREELVGGASVGELGDDDVRVDRQDGLDLGVTGQG